jgi:Protein of unknown function (DUF3667)
MHPTTCINCSTTYTGSFCNNCGQKTPHRFTLSHIFHELIHVFIHADKSFLSLVPQLLFKPGIVALDYVAGKRKRYFNIFQYLLIIVGITTFLVSRTHFMENVVKDVNSYFSNSFSARQLDFQQKAISLMQKYFNVIQVALIPIYAFTCWLFLGRKKYNYAENIVLHTVIGGQTNTLAALITIPFVYFFSNSMALYSAISLVLVLICYTLAYRQFYKLSVVKSFLFALPIYVVAYIVQTIIMSIFLVGYLLIQKIV